MGWLALDVGTSGVKAAVLEEPSGQPLSPIIKRSYPLEQPEPLAMVIQPDRLWTEVISAAREAIQGQAVSGVGFSVFSPGFILLDAHHQPLTPIITHLDRRARPAARKVWSESGQEFLDANGNKPLPGGISVMVWMQLKAMDPSLSRRVRHYFHLNSWLAWKWTGETAIDPGNACFAGLTEWRQPGQWSQRWCDAFGVEQEWLPPIRDGGFTVGDVHPALMRELGLSQAPPVKIGLADTSSALCAAALVEQEILHVVGTTQVLAIRTRHPVPSPHRLTRPLGLGSDFMHVTHNPIGGVALDWLHQLCFRDQSASHFYSDTLRQALQRSTEVQFDPPFLGGDRLEIEARHAAFQNLNLAVDRMDLLAALLQAMRRGHEQAWSHLDLKPPIQRIVLTGGGEQWMRALLPQYDAFNVQHIHQASLMGIKALFE